MKRIVYHVIVPALMPVLFFIVASTPVEVLGCFVRGLIALLIALTSGLAAVGAAVIGAKGGAKGRARHDRNRIWWVTSTLILVNTSDRHDHYGIVMVHQECRGRRST